MPGATVADSAGGGMHAAISIVAALLRRERTGEGAYLDVSTTNGVLFLMALQIDQYLATGEEAGPRTTLLTGKYACYDVYECRDGKPRVRRRDRGSVLPRTFARRSTSP